MNKLILLGTIFLMSCASSNYKRRDIYQARYTVRKYYLPQEQFVTNDKLKPTKSAIKPTKSVKKKASRLDCERVFQEINKCSM